MTTTPERVRGEHKGVDGERPASTGERLLLGIVAGIFSGAIFMGVNMWFATTQGNPPAAPFELVSTLVLGADAMQTGGASLWLGVGIHVVLSALFGLLFALVVPLLRAKDNLPSIGALYGGLIYWMPLATCQRGSSGPWPPVGSH
jgi:hypothetical protein